MAVRASGSGGQRCFASASGRDYVGLASRRTLAILFTVRLGKVSLSRVLPTRYLGRCRLSSAPALSIKIKVSAVECELSHT